MKHANKSFLPCWSLPALEYGQCELKSQGFKSTWARSGQRSKRPARSCRRETWRRASFDLLARRDHKAKLEIFEVAQAVGDAQLGLAFPVSRLKGVGLIDPALEAIFSGRSDRVGRAALTSIVVELPRGEYQFGWRALERVWPAAQVLPGWPFSPP